MNVVVFSGTTEGRELSRQLAALGIEVTVSVATPLGQEEQGSTPGITVRCGRLLPDEMAALLGDAALCIDATHPYAVEATKNIKAAAEKAGVEYLRLLRPASPLPENCLVFESAKQAAEALAAKEGNLLLATGAKELAQFAAIPPERLYPRVLPTLESIAACEAANIPHRNIIAMQGPFSFALNQAMMEQFHIRWLVTKDGGAAGGFDEKAALAEFFAANPQIGEAALVSLSQTSRARIDSERDYCQRIMADADKSAGALASVEKMLENHRANRPALAEADTADSLQTVVAEKRAEADALLQSNALDAQRLADDKKQAEAHAAALVAAEKARAEKDKWDTLCKYLGDREGKQFRKVAQSFILSHLLNIANGYLCRFSDRYTLTCQPGSLVILVEDTHNPGVSQSANILSGGESFMVSLSLALALSRLNAADNGVDTLFIDEGFGTLSDECLTNVMDTLEALHQMGGRRVGIISHVDELSHRIPVQVRVERVDATRSEVEVVDTCGYAD